MNINFKLWLEMCGTGAIYDPKAKGDFNWWGSPGSTGTTGTTIKGNDPIKRSKNKSKKKKKK